jgi:hypothetical protein
VTNLGSVILESAYHHLDEYGTIPLFCTLGAFHDEVVVRNGPARRRQGRVCELQLRRAGG